MIEKIEKIVSCDAFKEFNWSSDTDSFKKFNLIYGWNGSGKTSLSRVFRMIEKKINPDGSVIKIKVDGNTSLLQDMIAANQVPNVKVFNKDYVDDTIFRDLSNVNPIFYISKENKDKAQELRKKQIECDKLSVDLQNYQNDLKKAIKAFDDHCVNIARIVKESLRSAGSANAYNNFNRKNYEDKVSLILKATNYENYILKGNDLDTVKLQTQATLKPELTRVSEYVFNYKSFESEVKRVLMKDVKLELLQRLVDNPTLGKWVKEGFTSYLGADNKCPFCSQTITDDLLESLKSHFNEEYNTLSKEIDELTERISVAELKLKNYKLPNKVELYATLTDDFESSKNAMEDYVENIIRYLHDVKLSLATKMENPIIEISSATCKYQELVSKIKSINDIIDKHNELSRNLQQSIDNARDKVALHYIVESMPGYEGRSKKIRDTESIITKYSNDLRDISDEISDLEAQLKNHRPAVNELNNEIEVFFSRGDIKFELEGNGYKITRNGEVVTNLSDGERSAIAILYFLKSLNISKTECQKCTAVIDDPVSSQDLNNLYSTFVYIMKKAERVDQFILLTHNFSMFKYARNWAGKNFKKHLRCFHQISCDTKVIEGVYIKKIEINNLPSQLCDYDSEYHYLFSLIYKYAQDSSDGTVEQQLFYGNIARKVIETFLDFKYPQCKELQKKYRKLNGFNEKRQMRIFRYINNLSHRACLEDYDPALLSITKQVMIDVLSLIEFYDKVHYDSFVEISG